jgi:hypothetical protein
MGFAFIFGVPEESAEVFYYGTGTAHGQTLLRRKVGLRR